jgi:hypothetical protein
MTLPLERLAIFAVDVGSKSNFGWACEFENKSETGETIEQLATKIVEMANHGVYLALGFECPLFIPCPKDGKDLGKQRKGEKGKPWSAGAGSTVALIGLQQLCWLLRKVFTSLGGSPLGTLDWTEFQKGGQQLFLWEAFVSGGSKTGSHVGDPLAAARAFRSALPNPAISSFVTCEEPISLAGLALYGTGWSKDPAILHQPTLVLKPKD